MKKIVIDTNVFLAFYESANSDTLGILTQIESFKSHLLLPNLIYDEFLRNRNRLLDEVIGFFKKPVSFHHSALVQSLDGYKSLKGANDNYYRKCKKIIPELLNIKKNPEKDVVFSIVTKIFESEDVEIIKYNDSIISKARKRHWLGNPPGTSKTNICDEIIWETVLAKSKHDIIIVARDGSYLDNQYFLNKEYTKGKTKERSREIIDITEKTSDAFKIIGEKPSPEIEKIEREQIEYFYERKDIPPLFISKPLQYYVPSNYRLSIIDGSVSIDDQPIKPLVISDPSETSAGESRKP
ncbi:MAG: DUF4935 domain-containing protein [Spirochaetes bacterium]|nr:DUF4935 domain-containing protein [Spirochaetota bacterium]